MNSKQEKTVLRTSHHQKGPPFYIKHQLISADLHPVVKITLNNQTSFHNFGFHIKYSRVFAHGGHFWAFGTS